VRVSFDVAGFLVAHRAQILAATDAEVIGRRLPHYEAAGAEETTKRLAALFDVVVTAAAENHLDPALTYADHIAAQRQQSGHDLGEIQLAINALEEQLWRAVTESAPVEAQGLALGTVSTILGAVKDRLACEYVSRAAGRPTHTLRIEELFRGTEAGQG
jgi:hypothetical protein